MRMHPARARKRIKLESIPKMAARTHCNLKNVRETADKPKPPNTPIGTKSWCRGEANGFGNHADVSTARVDMQKDDNNPKTTKNVGRTILMVSRDLFAKLSSIIGQSKVGQLAWTVELGQWASSEFGSQP